MDGESSSLRAKLQQAYAWLRECYELTGADPDGGEDWRLAPYAPREVKRLRLENEDLERLFEIQRTRMDKATALWREGHPERAVILPDLGSLLDWLIERGDSK